MRIEVDVDPDRLAKAAKYTGITDRSALVREAIDSLIQREAGYRLIALGASDPDAQVAPRRRGFLQIRRRKTSPVSLPHDEHRRDACATGGN